MRAWSSTCYPACRRFMWIPTGDGDDDDDIDADFEAWQADLLAGLDISQLVSLPKVPTCMCCSHSAALPFPAC